MSTIEGLGELYEKSVDGTLGSDWELEPFKESELDALGWCRQYTLATGLPPRGVYVLRLGEMSFDPCYYVGSSEQIPKRIRAHMSGSGSLWTRVRGFRAVENILPVPYGELLDAENEMTVRCVLKHGRPRVRGGYWVQCSNEKNATMYQDVFDEIATKITGTVD